MRAKPQKPAAVGSPARARPQQVEPRHAVRDQRLLDAVDEQRERLDARAGLEARAGHEQRGAAADRERLGQRGVESHVHGRASVLRATIRRPDERQRSSGARVRARHPRLREALVADARVTAAYRGERHEFRSRLDVAVQMLRLAWVSDAFAAQALYRVKARLQALGVPVLPRVAHRLAMALAQVSIGDPVVVAPGRLHPPRSGRHRRAGRDPHRRDDRAVGDDRPARRRRTAARRSSATSASARGQGDRRGARRRGRADRRRTRSWSTTSPPGATVVGRRPPGRAALGYRDRP